MNKKKATDARNIQLYEQIQKKYTINFRKSTDNSWGSYISGKTAIITHSKTDHVIASATHELLHFSLQISGYKRITCGISLNLDTHRELSKLCTCLDNEFQHHKMFPTFIQMGFKPEEFYNDDDRNAAERILNFIRQPNLSLIALSQHYLSLIAPGGWISTEQSRELKELFREYQGGIYRERFNRIDEIMEHWVASINVDAEPFIIQFLQNLDAGEIWISYSSLAVAERSFPANGFFSGAPFTAEDILAVHNPNLNN